jgi:hypothetical protein
MENSVGKLSVCCGNHTKNVLWAEYRGLNLKLAGTTVTTGLEMVEVLQIRTYNLGVSQKSTFDFSGRKGDKVSNPHTVEFH